MVPEILPMLSTLNITSSRLSLCFNLSPQMSPSDIRNSQETDKRSLQSMKFSLESNHRDGMPTSEAVQKDSTPIKKMSGETVRRGARKICNFAKLQTLLEGGSKPHKTNRLYYYCLFAARPQTSITMDTHAAPLSWERIG